MYVYIYICIYIYVYIYIYTVYIIIPYLDSFDWSGILSITLFIHVIQGGGPKLVLFVGLSYKSI